MNLRRSLALGAAGLAAMVALSACGFDYPTDRINTITAGANDRTGTVTILNAVVVSAQANSGTFVATFVNNSQAKTVSLQSASGDNTAISHVTTSSLTLKPNTLRNLAATHGFPVSGTFSLGQFVNITFPFDDGETAKLSVPVVADDGQWAGLDTSPPTGSPTSSPLATSTPTPSDASS